MLELKDISFTYPHSAEEIFRGLSLSIEDRSFVSIIGASGSGKTTLFRLLNGLEDPSSGSILLDGTPLPVRTSTKKHNTQTFQDNLTVKDTTVLRQNRGNPIGRQAHYAAYMPQQDLLFPWLTVEKNVMLPMTVQKKPKGECLRTAREMLARVGLSEWAGRYPRELSGGMRQRVSFARTLCAGADLLLLDEPFSALDSITRISLQEWLLDQWNALQKTILFITHDVEEAIFLSGRILVLTGRPVTGLQEYTVPLPDKRNRDMLLRPEIASLKESLISLLRQEAEATESRGENRAPQTIGHHGWSEDAETTERRGESGKAGATESRGENGNSQTIGRHGESRGTETIGSHGESRKSGGAV